MLYLKKRILFVILGVVIFVLLGAVLPFVIQPKIKETTKREVEQMSFMGEENGTERVRVLADNGQALEERIRLISQAEERIVLSTFEFRTDESGKDMLAALQAAAKRGVSVEILVDGMAAALRMTGNGYFRALSAMETAEIRVYNPISLITPWKLMGRMHDKYLIVDEEAYVLGGRNTYDYFLGGHDGYKNYDWDVLVYCGGMKEKEKMSGPELEGVSRSGTAAVPDSEAENEDAAKTGQGASMRQLVSYFESVWSLPLCKVYHDDSKELKKASVKRAGDELERRYEAMQKENPEWFQPCDYEKVTRPTNHIELVTNPTHSYAKEPVVFYTITQLMESAAEEVRFHTPYVICNDWMLRCLRAVCERVPNVYMMTNSVANNGNPFGAMDYEKYKGKILDTGVKILEYDGGVSYHGKCFVIDRRLSGIGSFNWDMRSVYIDTEMMLVIDSAEVNADLRREMERYEKDALAVKDEESYFNLEAEGRKAQEISLKKRARIVVLRILAGWARFLM